MNDSSLPGSVSDIYFGAPGRPLPDWRRQSAESSTDDDAPATTEERRAVAGMLGFDPAELDESVAGTLPNRLPTQKALVRKGEGTCKPGQRADLTGCTPATGESSNAGTPQHDRPEPPAPRGWGSLQDMADHVVARPGKYRVVRAGQINSDSPNFFAASPELALHTLQEYGAGEGREVNLWKLDPRQVAHLGEKNRLRLSDDELEELEGMGMELFSDPPEWFLDKLLDGGYSAFTDGSWLRTEDDSAVLGQVKPKTGNEKGLVSRLPTQKALVRKATSADVLRAVRELGGESRWVPLSRLGQKVGVTPAALHGLVQSLRASDKLTVMALEGRGGLSADEQRWAMPDPWGSGKVGAVMLRPQ
jgi:hypothetical protein